MLRIWIICLLLITVAGCKHRKASLAGDEPVKAEDFFAAFDPITLPYYAADTNIQKIADTTLIGYSVITQFIPDSVLHKLTAKDIKKIRIHPVGKIEKGEEIYLLADFNENKKATLFSFLFDKKNHFISSLKLLDNKADDDYMYSVSINREPTFLISREKTNADNQYFYTKNGFAYNKDAGGFIPVINDTNEDLKKLSEVINPIDTLPRKNKLSGDYVQNKKNFISLRDGRNTSTYLFFIHFEKNDGQCTGELKGDLKLVADNKAIFKESGDPCVIDFNFSGNEITVKEQGTCGNHRGIKCFFDDSYRKKKESKPAKKSKQNK